MRDRGISSFSAQLLTLLILVSSHIGYSQNFPSGHFSIQNYSPDLYKLQSQNFDMVQTEDGMLYFANNGGLLEYDGVAWHTIEITDQKAYSIEIDTKGNILVGSEGDFGILERSKTGKRRYRSLVKSEVTGSTPGNIREILCTSSSAFFFSSDSTIFSWDGSAINRIRIPGKIKSQFKAEDKIYVATDKDGLCILENNNLRVIQGGDIFSAVTISDVVEKGDTVILFTVGKGILKTDKKFSGTFTLVKSADPGVAIKDVVATKDYYVIGTDENGLLVSDHSLSNFITIDRAHGLIDDKTEKLYQGRQGILWVLTSNGISKIDINSPIRNYVYADGLNGVVQSITSTENSLLIATMNGVFKMDRNSGEKRPFISKLPDVTESYDLSKEKSNIYLSEFTGVKKLRPDGVTFETIVECAPWCVKQVSKDLLAIGDDGGFILYNSNTKKQYVIPEVTEAIRNITVDTVGNLWLGAETGVYRVKLNVNGDVPSPVIRKFTKDDKLPDGPVYYPAIVDGKVILGTTIGFYEYQSKHDRFIKNDDFGLDFVKGNFTVHRFSQDLNGNIWLVAYDLNDSKSYYIGFGKKTRNGYEWDNSAFRKISNEIIHAIYHQDKFTTWLGGPNGLYSYDHNADYNYRSDVQIQLKLFSINSKDSLPHENNKLLHVNDLRYSDQNITFQFYYPSYFDEAANQYSFFLEGFDNEWSEWSTDNRAVYSSLREGNYVLHAKGRDVFGNESADLRISFQVTPPWYRTWWAYLLFALALGALIYAAVWINSKRLRAANIRLEQTVKERTREIEEKNVTLEENQVQIIRQKDELQHKNKEITDSINYAKRLQQAMLPAKEVIRHRFTDSTILFKPKDIVSGDFYFFTTMEFTGGELGIVAAVDCTGHGVPGAFMSMLGHEKLTESVNALSPEQIIEEPGKVLSLLNRGIRQALKQSQKDDSTRDGMDMAFCAVESGGNKTMVHYAGANRPLWILRRDAEEIEEIKPTKSAIGGFTENDFVYASHHVELFKGDAIFIFTDGFADQFGSNDKKLMVKNFKAQLYSVREKSMEDQEHHLDDFIEEWRGETEQTDDILVIGIRV